MFMAYSRAYALSTLAVVAVLALPADGQSVISTHSGVVHFFEGAVYLDDQPLELHLGKFSSMAEGTELRTAQGRAEVLLTPGVFLRVDAGSSIRMISNVLSDTRILLLTGSVLVDSGEPSSGTSVTLLYKDWDVHFRGEGTYRVDAEPPGLWVQQGAAEVSAGGTGSRVSVEPGMYLPFTSELVPQRSSYVSGDVFTDWAKGRSESISADNAITAQIDEDSASRNSGSGVDNFAYFPLIGVPSVNSGLTGGYGSLNPYQLGFSSIYLPGYSYRPFLFGLAPGGIRSYPYSPPRRVGIFPTVPAPRPPFPQPAPGHPVPHPGLPVPPRVAHGGVHR
jgi:hypothetical protein